MDDDRKTLHDALRRECAKLDDLQKEESDLYTKFCGARHRRTVQEGEVHHIWNRLNKLYEAT